jgi:YfiH family protein
MWIKAPNISVKHGFSTRKGGISPAPFDSLNLAGSDDLPENLEKNRTIALNELGISPSQIANLKQIHGCDVVCAKPGTFTGDALVTNEKGIAIAVAAADCYPLLFHDAEHHVIGAAHAGWRGTVARIAAQTISKMLELGSKAENIQMAIGPGICLEHFEVGAEVHEQFRKEGFPENIFYGKNIDLVKANEFAALEMGLKKEHIWSLQRCTYETDFFSYRRDGGKTGRMWGVIML